MDWLDDIIGGFSNKDDKVKSSKKADNNDGLGWFDEISDWYNSDDMAGTRKELGKVSGNAVSNIIKGKDKPKQDNKKIKQYQDIQQKQVTASNGGFNLGGISQTQLLIVGAGIGLFLIFKK